MVSKEGVQQQGIGLSSGESGERGWLQKRRVASTRGPGGAGSQLGCHVSPALRTLSHWGTG